MPEFSKVYVEIGNICNLQCSFCPEVERKKFQMAEEELRKILLQVKPHAKRACYHLMGEPTGHPLFDRMVEVAVDVGLPLEITTNGTMVQKFESALLLPIVHQVNFSLQSYLDNFPATSPEPYFEKILSFTELALEKRPDLFLNYRFWNLQDGEELDERNELFLAMVEKRFGVNLNRRVNPKLTKSKRVVGRLYLHYDTRFEWPSPTAPLLRTKGSCYGTRTQLGIHADGTVVPCCLDKEATIKLGNINTQSFEEILLSPRLLKMRSGFLRGELVEDLCQRCEYSTRFKAP